MQLRRCSVAVASHIADGHGRFSDAELRKSLGAARGSLYEMETQADLAKMLGFLPVEAEQRILELATEVAKLINGLAASLIP
jgi:four helix bundle protein